MIVTFYVLTSKGGVQVTEFTLIKEHGAPNLLSVLNFVKFDDNCIPSLKLLPYLGHTKISGTRSVVIIIKQDSFSLVYVK